MHHARVGIRLAALWCGVAVGLVSTNEATAQGLRAMTGKAAGSITSGPSPSGFHHGSRMEALSDISGQVDHHFTVQRNMQNIVLMGAQERAAAAATRAEAARLGSRVCRTYEHSVEFDGPGGSIVDSRFTPARGPAFVQAGPKPAKPPTAREEAEYLERARNTMTMTRQFCADPPRLPASVGVNRPLASSPTVPNHASGIGNRPAFSAPPRSASSGQPSLLRGATGGWDGSRYSLGVDYGAIGRDFAAWSKSMEAKHPWLKKP